MKKWINKTLLMSMLFAATLVLSPSAAKAADPDPAASSNNKSAVCEGVAATGGSCGSGGQIDALIKNVVNFLSVLVGIISVIMIIVGGFKYITSSGDSNNIKSAKDTITYAIVGLIVVALAQVIVAFVLTKATSSVEDKKTMIFIQANS